MKLPYELQREALLWLPGGKETTELRTVSKQWNGILERHVAVCCVHRYGSREMACCVVHLLQSDTVATLLFSFAARSRELASDSTSAISLLEDVAKLTKGSICTFPHCYPMKHPCTQQEGSHFALNRPSADQMDVYSPQLISPHSTLRELQSTRFIVTDRTEQEATSVEDSFPSYMRLLLKFQVKHQEHAFEHLARLRLLRTYITNLENRVHCKLKLLLEQVGHICVTYKVLLLPYLEESIVEGMEVRRVALRLQLSRYKLVHDQVEAQKDVVKSARRPDVASLGMRELEEYAAFLCGADDSLETHVDTFRTLDHVAKVLPSTVQTKLPQRCRLDDSPTLLDNVVTNAEHNTEKEEKKETGEGKGPEPQVQTAEEDDLSSLPFDVSVQPAVVVLREIMSVCAAQRAFLYQSLARHGLKRMEECRVRLEAQKREQKRQQEHLKHLTAVAAAMDALSTAPANSETSAVATAE